MNGTGDTVTLSQLTRNVAQLTSSLHLTDKAKSQQPKGFSSSFLLKANIVVGLQQYMRIRG